MFNIKFTRKDRKEIYKSKWIDLFVDSIETESGNKIPEYHVLHYKNKSVCVIVENEKKQLLFVKANRYITNDAAWEIPAGGVEDGEDSIVAAKREVKEETGYDIRNVRKIYTYMPSNGMSDQIIDICFANLNTKEQDNFDKEEIEEVRWYSIDEINKLIYSNIIIDGVSLIGLLLYKDRERVKEKEFQR